MEKGQRNNPVNSSQKILQSHIRTQTFQLINRLFFNLSNPFLGNAEHIADLFQ